jgi:hypothetical protein
MKIKRMGWFVRLITFNWPVAITLAPFGIYVKDQCFDSATIRNHELIHWAQQMEMLIIPFYFWYIIEWLVKLFIYGSHAYMHLSFEREAHYNDNDVDYLKIRNKFAWIKFV